MNTALIAITRHGILQASRLAAALEDVCLYVPEKFRAEAEASVARNVPGRKPAIHSYTGKLGEQIASLFERHEALVAVVSLGAVVRLIAPHLKDKESDPAVLVVDEAGQFVIPVLSGHRGGANALAGRLAQALDATPVLTTASDVRQTLAVDLLGQEFGWQCLAHHDDLVSACAAMVNDAPVALVQEAGETDWWSRHANGRNGPRPANLQYYGRIEEVPGQCHAAVLWITTREWPDTLTTRFDGPLIRFRPLARPPLRLALGLGCDRNTPAETLLQAIDEALQQIGACPADVETCASIDLKRDEAGLLEAVARHGWPLTFYPAARLAEVEVPHPSETVRRYTGTPSVAEAAALLAADAGPSALLLEKHKRRGPDGRNATVSIARRCS